jgi:glycosidase
MKYWLSKGIGGWRMDVVPWVSDQFWREWRAAIKETYPEAFTISEVWFDASKYFTGDMFDSTMNYIFRAAVLNFAKGGSGVNTVNALEMTRENYPEHVFYRTMNLLSGHDLPRALFEVGYQNPKDNYEQSLRKLKLAFVFQYVFPGSPTLYYGDEVGLNGGHDPMNRKTYPWKEDGGNGGDEGLLQFVRKLGWMRKINPALSSGDLQFVKYDPHMIVMSRKENRQTVYIVLNNSLQQKDVDFFATPGSYRSLLTSKTYVSHKTLSIPVPGYGFEVVALDN